MRDVTVIGGGVVGCAVARELSAWDLDILLVEKEEDVCSGTSKANSAIVHAGFDAAPGSLKAKFNVLGSRMMAGIAKELDVPYVNNQSMVLAVGNDDAAGIRDLYDRGIKNGVEGLKVLTGDEARELEPALSKEVTAALLAETGAIVCPFELTAAYAECAASNGAEFRFLSEVTGLRKIDGGYELELSDGGKIQTRYVVNAAGIYADIIHNMVSEKKLSITARKGSYLLMDKEAASTVGRTIFRVPGKMGKGVLVTPTVHGNLMSGPTADDEPDRDNTATTADALSQIKSKASEMVENVPFKVVITSFAGLRAHEAGGDFVLGECGDAPGFYDAAGIESPGLTAAPAIGVFLANEIAKASGAGKKADYRPERKGIPAVSAMSDEERAALIEKDPDYGKIVCRCESVTEGEIREAIRRKPGARSMDGIKRRVRAGMGRCQAGFCTPRVMEILSEELGVPMEEIRKNRPGSELLI
ncbi:MAG: NAD(P)/FAD-dependent oxidoreductase [Lachnospiraceae bacterium]|nr:NAD(P)/FAD-dependent oxidoreductase [Lachnospiraceae bacterium]